MDKEALVELDTILDDMGIEICQILERATNENWTIEINREHWDIQVIVRCPQHDFMDMWTYIEVPTLLENSFYQILFGCTMSATRFRKSLEWKEMDHV